MGDALDEDGIVKCAIASNRRASIAGVPAAAVVLVGFVTA